MQDQSRHTRGYYLFFFFYLTLSWHWTFPSPVSLRNKIGKKERKNGGTCLSKRQLPRHLDFLPFLFYLQFHSLGFLILRSFLPSPRDPFVPLKKKKILCVENPFAFTFVSRLQLWRENLPNSTPSLAFPPDLPRRGRPSEQENFGNREKNKLKMKNKQNVGL